MEHLNISKSPVTLCDRKKWIVYFLKNNLMTF